MIIQREFLEGLMGIEVVGRGGEKRRREEREGRGERGCEDWVEG